MKASRVKFKILSHTADFKIKVFGKTKKELFLNTVTAMASVLVPQAKEKKERIRPFKVQSTDLPALLVDFLNETLYFTQVNQEIYTDIKFKKLTDREIEGELIGQKIDKFREDIKAATYHSLYVRKNLKGWEATILFDI